MVKEEEAEEGGISSDSVSRSSTMLLKQPSSIVGGAMRYESDDSCGETYCDFI